jgi:uncharacterized protein YbjT (DUF2867 family)
LNSILQEGRIYTAAGDGRVPFIDAGDIAAVAVEALTSPGLASGEHVLTGPAALTYDEAAQAISEATGRHVDHCRLSTAELTARYTGFGMPQHYAQILARMDEAIAAGAEDRTTREVENITGRPPTTLENWLAVRRADFTPA